MVLRDRNPMLRKFVSVQQAVVAVGPLASVISGTRHRLLDQKFTEGNAKSIRAIMARHPVALLRVLQPAPVQRVWRKS